LRKQSSYLHRIPVRSLQRLRGQEELQCVKQFALGRQLYLSEIQPKATPNIEIISEIDIYELKIILFRNKEP
jgi:hypothetical protein